MNNEVVICQIEIYKGKKKVIKDKTSLKMNVKLCMYLSVVWDAHWDLEHPWGHQDGLSGIGNPWVDYDGQMGKQNPCVDCGGYWDMMDPWTDYAGYWNKQIPLMDVGGQQDRQTP